MADRLMLDDGSLLLLLGSGAIALDLYWTVADAIDAAATTDDERDDLWYSLVRALINEAVLRRVDDLPARLRRLLHL